MNVSHILRYRTMNATEMRIHRCFSFQSRFVVRQHTSVLIRPITVEMHFGMRLRLRMCEELDRR